MGYERDKRLGLVGLTPEQRAARLQELDKEWAESAARQKVWRASCEVVAQELAAGQTSGAGDPNPAERPSENSDQNALLLSCFPFLASDYQEPEPPPAAVQPPSEPTAAYSVRPHRHSSRDEKIVFYVQIAAAIVGFSVSTVLTMIFHRLLVEVAEIAVCITGAYWLAKWSGIFVADWLESRRISSATAPKDSASDPH